MPRLSFLIRYATVCICSCLGIYAAHAEDVARIDLMSFAQGTLPVTTTSSPSDLRVDMEKAIAAIDGNAGGYVAVGKPALIGDVVEMTFSLQSPTTFDSFAIPNVLETPSPFQTFFKHVELLGSDESPDGPYVPLATVELATHSNKGEMTELTMRADQPAVRWVRLRLSDGIDVQREKTFLEFSELIGTGIQAAPALSDGFQGVWKGRGVKLELAQTGATVEGCYDGNSKLTGTVEGRVLRALGKDPAGILSQFILIASEDGTIRGLRSTNGAPFKPYDGETSDNAPACLAPETPKLSCGAIVHGIGFQFDSDAILPASQVVINDLFAGLSQDNASGIEIIGHSSSEGSENYNRDLSQRRAQSVANALVALGINPSQISASGRGEDDPIASNDDEAGRSINRRVEVQCAD